MEPSSPAWYDELQGNPVKQATFTEEMKATIRKRAHASSPVRRTRRSRAHIAIVGAAGIACCLLFFFVQGMVLEDRQNLGTSAHPFTDSVWQEAVDAEYTSSRNAVLFRHDIGDDKVVIFNRKMYELNGLRSIAIGVDEFVLEARTESWQRRSSITYSIGDPVRDGSEERLIAEWAKAGGSPVAFGVTVDATIDKVEIVDDRNRRYPVNEIQLDGYTYWFVVVPAKEKRTYRAEGVDENGVVVSRDYDYYFKVD